MRTLRQLACVFLVVAPAVAAWAQGADRSQAGRLKQAAKGLFDIGVGIDDRIADRVADHPLLLAQFSTVTPENCMKPAHVQAAEGRWNFAQADGFVDFATKHGLKVVGHCLVWAKDDRTPAWFFRDGDRPASRELLLDRMQRHIETEVTRYRGRIAMWDVVNEALDDGNGYLRVSGWSTVCGEEFIAKAFEHAHAADPDAMLIYNDYNNELPGKREKQIRLVRSLRERNVPIHAVGLQGHYEIDRVPFKDIEDTLIAMRQLGVKVVISELDIDVIPRGKWWAEGGKYREELSRLDPYREGCPPEILKRQADQYAQLFRIFRRHADTIARVSFWDLHDGQSWLNNFPWKRVNYPLLFDRQGKPKPAFAAVMSELTSSRAPGGQAAPGGYEDHHLPNKHLIAQNIANGRQKIENPNPLVSILNFHYAHPPDTVGMNLGLNRVISDDETGFRGKADALYRSEGWDFILAGGGAYSNLDYSFTPGHPAGTLRDYGSPGGGSPELRNQLHILKEFMEGFDFIRMRPRNDVVKGGSFTADLGGATGDAKTAQATVRVLAEEGRAYAIYILGGKRAELVLELPPGKYQVAWLNTKTGHVDKAEEIQHDGGRRKLTSPAYTEDIALSVKRSG